MNRYAIPFVISVFLMGSSVRAADIPCEGCSYAQMMSDALGQGKGEHRVYSFPTGEIHRFSVTCSGGVVQGGTGENPYPSKNTGDSSDTARAPEVVQGGDCPFNRPLQIDEIPLDGETAASWPIILEFIQVANWHNGGYDLEIDTRQPGMNYQNDSSLYRTLGDYSARNALFSDIYQTYSVVEKFAQALGAALRAHLQNFPNQLLIRFVFKDGTSVLIKYDATTTQFEFVKNSARQPNGDSLVENNTSEYIGNYNMGGVDQQAYLDYLGSMGVPIVDGGLAGRLVCSWDGVKLTCKLPRMNN